MTYTSKLRSSLQKNFASIVQHETKEVNTSNGTNQLRKSNGNEEYNKKWVINFIHTFGIPYLDSM